MTKVIYNAIVLTEASVELLKRAFPAIHSNKFYHHITLNFGTGEKHELIGQTVRTAVTGYKADDKGQAVTTDCTLVPSGKIAHVTLSCADGVKPVYSNELLKDDIEDLILEDKSLVIEGIIKAFTSDGWVSE